MLLLAGSPLLFTGLGAGCGWNTGLAAPGGSVGVEWFGNDTPEPGVEIDLSRELSRAIGDLVDARLVAPDAAAVVVNGRVEGFQRRRGVRNRENGLLETGVEVIAYAQLQEGKGGPVLSSARASVWAGFAVDLPENDALATQRAIHKIADELVLELFAPVSDTTAEEAAGAAPEERPGEVPDEAPGGASPEEERPADGSAESAG
jgi:hypothetical protein